MRVNEQKNTDAVETGVSGADSGTPETGTESFAADSMNEPAAQTESASGSKGTEPASDAGQVGDSSENSANGAGDSPAQNDKKGRTPENAKAAEVRRAAADRQAATISKAEENARVAAIIEALDGVNPYTKGPMKDAEDVAVFLKQREIEKNGGDPVTGFAEALAETRRAETKRAEEEAARERWFADDAAAFTSAHPDVKLDELLQNEDFAAFAEGKVGVKPLSEIYESYTAMVGRQSAEAQTRADREAAQKLANAEAGTGSVKGQGAAAVVTRKQLLSMGIHEATKFKMENPAEYKRIMNGS